MAFNTSISFSYLNVGWNHFGASHCCLSVVEWKEEIGFTRLEISVVRPVHLCAYSRFLLHIFKLVTIVNLFFCVYMFSVIAATACKIFRAFDSCICLWKWLGMLVTDFLVWNTLVLIPNEVIWLGTKIVTRDLMFHCLFY